MNIRTLGVLMWKHGVVRKRRFIQTAMEFLAPIFFFVILFIFRDKIHSKPTHAVGEFIDIERPGSISPKHHDGAPSGATVPMACQKETPCTDPNCHTTATVSKWKQTEECAAKGSTGDRVSETDSTVHVRAGSAAKLASQVRRHKEAIPLNRTMVPPTVLYTPDTNLTAILMEIVGEKLNLKRLQSFSSGTGRGYMPFTNDSDIFDFTKNMRPDEAILIFQNVSEGTWPKKLNYTIRMKTPFKTHMTTAMDGGLMPHQRFGAMYEPFMRLQWAIDTSYIQILTGKPLEQNVVLQEFPYVKFSKSDSAELVTAILFPVCWLSLFVNFVFLMTRLLQERASGIQELMKMMGVSTNVLGMTHVFNVMGPCLVYSVGGTILLKTGDYTLLEKSNGFLIFFALYSHFFATIAMAFACSYIAKSTQYIITLGTLAYVVLWAPANLLYQNNIPKSLVLATGFLPYAPMGWIWAEIGALEKIGQGLTFTTMMSSHTNKSGSAIAAMTLLGLQAVFFFALAWYFDHVRPGRYGHALPWDFLLQRSYWVKNNVKPDSASRQLQRPASHDERYFEPPGAREVGISVHNVTKMFPKQRALNDVSLDVYKGEITILLGHNGAGKTTLMSIITGMIGPTSGKVLVNGLDMSSEKEAARQHIGLCPQHNLFFPDLTVLEHVMFFTLLKGSSFFEARISSLALLDKLGIKAKADNMSDELSGGMKRRLQLACALAGNARVLILDEPTSGLDVETRRELWDLLLSLRGSRTVLLSTHFMEEADALGDRVAALHAGQLRCHATPMYLKRALGTGYRLTFTTIGQPKEDPMTNVIQSIVPDAAVKETTINSISYNLPAASSKHFPSLFTKLESQRSGLGIDSIGVGITTLEEVFLRLCSDVDTSRSQDELDGNLGGMASEPTFNILSGPRLYIRQILMLMKRQLLFLWYKRMYFFSLQVLIPVLLMCTFTLNSNNAATGDVDNPALAMNLDVYKDMPGYRMLYNLPKGEASLKPLDDYPNVKFEETGDVNEAVLNAGRRSVLEYNQYLAGVELNDTEAKVMYTTLVRHAAPSALNLLTNLLAARVLPWAGGKTLTTINHPLPGAQVPYMTDTIVQPKAMVNSVTWGVILVFVFLSAISGAASLPCRERVTGARHIHIMAGCPAELHWAATLLFHTLIHATTLIVPAMIICAALDDDKTFTDPKFIRRLRDLRRLQIYWAATLLFHTLIHATTLIVPAMIICAALDDDKTFTDPKFIMCLGLSLVLGLMAFLALTYLVSFYFQENGTGGVLFCSIILFVLVMPMLKAVGSMKMERSFSDRLLSVSSAVAPPHTLVSAVLDSIFTARHNTLCNLNRDKCPVLPVAESDFDIDDCCKEEVAPPHSLVSAVLDSIFTARHNTLCNLNRDKCPVLPVAESDFDIDACCTSDPNTNAFCYFCLDEGAPGKWLFYMFGQIVILMTLVFLTQRGLFKRMWDAALNARYAPPAPRFNDEVVRAERAYVEKAIELPLNSRYAPPAPRFNDEVVRAERVYVEKAIELPDRQIADALLASDIHKRYRGLCSSCNAVKGVSFSVKKGECFGLLGVNGAGKSSMFQVLTGEQWPTRGRIFANGQRMDGYSAQYLRGLGYCPQFSGLDEFLTGRQNLNLLLALRGLCAGDAAAEALAWINVVGLQKYIDRKVIGYSGGCVRRLAAAAALCNGAPLTLLDEPTSGVDVSARRRVWAALRRGLKNQRSIIITSHSMDEMEALCTRICIMSAGEACALGSPAGLRARHAAGHAVLIKVRADHADHDQHPAGDEVDSSKTLVNQLKGMLQQKFNCTLKDEHKTMLHYHINETMQYSSLFQELEQLKASFPTLVEDYSVTETTLEEVFLSFAKPPPEPEGAARPV